MLLSWQHNRTFLSHALSVHVITEWGYFHVLACVTPDLHVIPRAQFKNKTNFPTSLLCGIRYFHFLKKEREREREREREKSVAYSKFSHANQGFSRFNQIVVLLLQDLIHMVSLFFFTS